jgi:hypothetical protein
MASMHAASIWSSSATAAAERPSQTLAEASGLPTAVGDGRQRCDHLA